MSINIENFKLARQWLAEWPDENFDMAHWMKCDGLSRMDFEVVRRNVGNHICGSVACFGGIIECRQDMEADMFLGLTNLENNRLFLNVGAFYGIDGLDIPKEKVIAAVDQIIAAGRWPDKFE